MNEKALELHKVNKGKIEVVSKIKLDSKESLALAYTPGVADVCMEIYKNPLNSYVYTSRQNMILVVSDGSAVLGLGNIGPLGAMPVMEGKAIIFKEFAGIDAFPIVLDTQDTDEIITTIKNIAPSFGGINLEDISAPRCFEIEERLKEILDIPVFHDDQHGTAIVVLAGLINASKLVHKSISDLKIVINGAGAAGIAITKLLIYFGIKNIIMCDSKGIISTDRSDINVYKKCVLDNTYNFNNISTGGLSDAIKTADVFIGVSKPDLLTKDMIKNMASDPIVFALANPIPEIMPDIAKSVGAKIVATGRSDLPNQINNALVFPGLFRAVLDKGIKIISDDIKIKTAIAIAEYVTDLKEDNIVPSVLDSGLVKYIGEMIR